MTRTLRIAAGVAAAALLATTAASARADHDHDHGWHRHRFYRLAETDVRQVVSGTQGRRVFRAVVGVAQNTRPYLAIERLSGAALRSQFFVWRTRLDGRRARLWQRLTRTEQVHLLRWQGATLRFRLRIGPDRYRCAITAQGPGSRVAACQRQGRSAIGGLTALPPSDWKMMQPHWNKAVARACDNTFTGQRNQRICVSLARRARFDPRGMIRACRFAVRGGKNRLACIRIASTAHLNPAPAIGACGRGNLGNRGRLACVRAAVRRQPPPGVYVRDHR